jgi:thioredoxin-like negative regulator of GroEL
MPCKLIAPAVEKLAEELKGIVNVLKSNVDENPQIATDLSIMNIPTLVLFKGGKEVSRITGVNSKEAIEAKRLAASSGVSLSEWFGNLVRAKSTHKFMPRNSTGRPPDE